MKIPVHIAQKLLQLSRGENLSSSEVKHPIIEELITEGILARTGRIQKKLHLLNPDAFFLFLQNKYGISALEKYIEILQQEHVTRSELTAISSNSKLKSTRTFKGFLINSYISVEASWKGEQRTFHFTAGVFQFMYDFEDFIPHEKITIVGVENAENFRWIEKQQHLFKGITPLFVSRYPQNQSKDLLKWLQSIPNNYLHFGDLDLAGINIYLNEYKRNLGDKATFFVPENIETYFINYGNKTRYNQQKQDVNTAELQDENLIQLLQLIHQYKCGIDQEIFIED